MNALQPAAGTDRAREIKGSTGSNQAGFRLTPYLFLSPTLGLLIAFSLIPLFYGFWMSLHKIDILHGKAEFIGLENYFSLLHDPKFGLSLAGFALAKFKFPGRSLIFIVILTTLLIPLQVLMVPVFLVLKTLGWVNQLIGIIVPPAATPTGTFMMRQFIRGIPDEMIEAARLDGASDWEIYRHIVLPLCAPMSAALGIISFTWRWNDYLWPLIVVNNQDKFTLQLSLANLVGTNTVEWGTLLAYAILVLIPVLVVFLLFQRLFLKGQVGAAVKG